MVAEEIKRETPKGINLQKHKGFGAIINKGSCSLLMFLISIIGVAAS